MARPEVAQRRVLGRLLARNAGCRFGRKHGFAAIRSVEEFQRRVPVCSAGDLQVSLAAIAGGEPDELFPGRPLSLQPTSGSTGGTKLIPYTSALQAEFQAGLAPWVFDLFRRHPRAAAGRAYWSISPAMADAPPVRPDGVRVGFADDAEYLHPAWAGMVRRALAVPASVARQRDLPAFRRGTLSYLLAARDLSLVSVWNPSFFTLLLQALDAQADGVLADLRERLHAPSARMREVEDALSHQGGERHARLWPALRVVSCWGDAAARPAARELSALLPQAVLEPKGLLATEGMVSIPVGGGAGGVPALTSHFLEFIPEDEPGSVHTVWQLEPGRAYAVVLTTGGGLYRYRLGDFVRVTGTCRGIPRIEFVGRGDCVSDRYGEKLHEAHVLEVVQSALSAAGVKAPFAILAPDDGELPDRYVLFLAGPRAPGEMALHYLAAVVDSGLRRNVQYAHCRRLRQLKEVDAVWVEQGTAFAFERHQAWRVQRGQKPGDVKPPALDLHPGWRARLGCTCNLERET